MPGLTGTAITIFGLHYAPETTGNAPYTTAMAESLADAGASVRVVTGIPHYPQWKVLDQKYRRGLRWREGRNGVELTRVRHVVPTKPNLLGRAGLELTFFVQCVAAGMRDKSDVLVAVTPTLSGLGAAIICRRGRPVGVLVQDLTGASAAESGTSSGLVGGQIGRMEYWLLKRVDQIGIITPRFGNILIANGIDPSKLADLPNFTHVTPVAASAPEARERLGWEEQFTVVHTGNMGMKQGLEAVVEAARLAEIRGLAMQFVLVGDGNQRVALEQLSAGCTKLQFVDPLSADDYPYALAAADVLLVCERKGVREMSLPSKLTSYTVAGRPIVAAVERDGITAEALNRHGSALQCQSGDPAALLDTVQTIKNSPETAGELRATARLLHRNQYGAESAYARYRDFIDNLCARRRIVRSDPRETERDHGLNSVFHRTGIPGKNSQDRLRTHFPVRPVVLIVERNTGGHRLMYVRVLAVEALRRGAEVILGLPLGAEASPTFLAHLSRLQDEVRLVVARPGLGHLQELSAEQGADVTVVPDGDRVLTDLVRALGWHGRGELRVLVMRSPAISASWSARKTFPKKFVMLICSMDKRVRVVRLVSAFESKHHRFPIMAVAPDPAEIGSTLHQVERLRADWNLNVETYWFLVIGAISARKNLDLILDAAIAVRGEQTIGVVIAGSIEDSVMSKIIARDRSLAQAGVRVRIRNHVLDDGEFDAAIMAADCVVLAHSNEGPSGIFAKAAVAGTRVLAAGAISLRHDCEKLPSSAIWVPLSQSRIASAMIVCSTLPRPTPTMTSAAQRFAEALL